MAAVLFRKGVEELEKILRFYLGSLKKHTMFKGEVVESILTAWMLQGQVEVTSYVDSQAFMRAIGGRKMGLGQYLFLKYLRLTDITNNRTDVPSTAGTKKFAPIWVVAHEGVAEGQVRSQAPDDVNFVGA